MRSLLNENYSKGSTGILNNNNLVKQLADAVKRDVKFNTAAFPAGFNRDILKMNDRAIAEWFVGHLDRIEQEGYEGVIYSRNGVNNLWIVNNYIKRKHNWEDISGTLSMNMSKWYFLKNRNLLEPLHDDVGKFDSIRDIGQHLVFHYQQKLADYQERVAAEAKKRAIRAYKLVDNDDYRIYTTLNRAANINYGLGTTWCTSSSSQGNPYFKSYASKAMLFQLYPYESEEVKLTDNRGRQIEGKERYQFDAGGPNFMNIGDLSANKEHIKTKYPYLYDDLKTALETQKSQLQSYIDQAAKDPSLVDEFSKIISYDVDQEIGKLESLKRAGWVTDKKRPVEPPAIENN
jgi:hypothetical protein